MSAAGAHEYHQRQHLPPSPPPSPPVQAKPEPRKRRNRKKPDPFEQLATTPIPSLPCSPANDVNDNDEQEPLLKRIVLTPIFFISFLISLFLVNYRNRARRTEAQPSSAFSLLAYLSPSNWLDPEPYQDPGDSTWGRGGTIGHVEPHDAIGPRQDGHGEDKTKKRTSWHLHKKIRQVAKLEIGDALEMRGRVIVVMITIMGLGCIGLWMLLKWFVVSMSNMLFGAKA